MSSTRDDQQEQSGHRTILSVLRESLSSAGTAIGTAAGATFIAHPSRVALNKAPLCSSLRENFRQTQAAIMKGNSGLFMNVRRGSVSSGAQFFVKPLAQEHGGFAAGVLASAVVGASVATFFETPLIRKNNLPKDFAKAPGLKQYSLTLSALYFVRELGFTLGVLTKNDMTPTTQLMFLLGTAAVTAPVYKLIVSEATRNYLKPGITTPNFREGFGTTIGKIARGDYTHPEYQVKYKGATDLAKQISNFAGAVCGKNVYTCRVLYTLLFQTGAYIIVPFVAVNTYHYASLGKQRLTAMLAENTEHEERRHRP